MGLSIQPSELRLQAIASRREEILFGIVERQLGSHVAVLFGIAIISPKKNAALATSSITVGPDGKERNSSRRCGLPSVIP